MSYDPRIEQYMLDVEEEHIKACREQQLLVAMVREVFKQEDISTDSELLTKYLSLQKYFHFNLFPWEVFLLGLNLCTFRVDGLPRWPDLFMLVGRGAGKDGYIGYQGFCLTGPFNPARRYDVDICANSELQAKAPVDDVLGVLEAPENNKKLLKHFYWNKEEIIGLKTKARMKYRTNNPKGKDGLRSGQVVFNEIHQYENYDNINVFTTGLGKKQHPRRLYATTDGDVRDGPLDHYKEHSLMVLNGDLPDNGWLPFICRLDDKAEVNDPAMWEKANPSLPYMPALMEEIGKEHIDWKRAPSQFTAFMTKRMNLPESNPEVQVTTRENLIAASEPIPEDLPDTCVAGIDYAKVKDMVAVVLLFRKGDKRYIIRKTWLCLNSSDLPRIKAPWRDWASEGLLELVDDIEVAPELVAGWLQEMMESYHVKTVALDDYRYGLMRRALEDIGFDAKDRKNIRLVRPSDQARVSPIIDSCFDNGFFRWGDDPLMRWAVNNTKLVAGPRDRDKGNYAYGKIEPRSRKTDPFMALVAAMCVESELEGMEGADIDDFSGPWVF